MKLKPSCLLDQKSTYLLRYIHHQSLLRRIVIAVWKGTFVKMCILNQKKCLFSLKTEYPGDNRI